MAVRYFISLVLTIMVLLFTNLVLGLGFSFVYLLNLPSIVIVIIFPMIFMWILHGWKNIKSAFTIFCKKDTDKNELLNAKVFFKNYSKTLFSIAFIVFLMSFMAMMTNLEVKEHLGPNMALASVLIVYTGIINMVIIIPYNIIINRKIMQIEE